MDTNPNEPLRHRDGEGIHILKIDRRTDPVGSNGVRSQSSIGRGIKPQ